ncbi:MAG: YeeE/YedE thiosulfate transporter family protein [Clostridia bacterium]
MSNISRTESTSRSSAKKKATPEQRKRRRIIQIIAGIVLVIGYIILAIYVQTINPRGAFLMTIGLGLGYVLQRSRFCFTASLRDPLLTGTTTLTKAVLIALMLSSVVYAGLQMKITGFSLQNMAELTNINSALPGNIGNAGIHTVIGGFIFGIGAVIAGGCASGTLMRVGEGFVQQWIAIVFFVVGSMFGSSIYASMQGTFLRAEQPVYLPQALGGWVPALVVQFGVLSALYILADWYGKKKAGEL